MNKERIPKQPKHFYGFGPFRLLVVERELFQEGEPVNLPPKALDTLLELVRQHGHVVEKSELLQTLWPDAFVEEDSLVKQVSRLRKALGQRPDGGPYIETIARRGYRFSARVTESWEEEAGEPQLAVAGPSEEAKPARRGRRLVWLLGAACVLAVGVTGWLVFLRPGPGAPDAVVRGVPLTSYPGHEEFPSLSPDGNQVAFAWQQEQKGDYDIYVKLVGLEGPLQLTSDPADDIGPMWSPDGRRIAFYRVWWPGRWAIYLVSPLGGSERKLADLVGAPPGWPPPVLSWSQDGRFLAFEDRNTPKDPPCVFLLSVETGERRQLAVGAEGFLRSRAPAFSPDGRCLALVGEKDLNVADIYMAPVAGGEPKRLTFDDKGIWGLAWTPDGRELVFSSNRAGPSMLWRISVSGGSPEHLAWAGEDVDSPVISPQGHRLAFARTVQDTNIYRAEVRPPSLERQPPTKLVASTRRDENAYYSPDGKRIAFSSNRSGNWELWVCDSDGSNPVQLTSFGGLQVGLWGGWSPDGKLIAFDANLKGSSDIYVIGAEGGAPRRVTTHPGLDARGNWSPDGQWIYFGSNRTGTYQVWKVPPEGGDPVQVTKEGGWIPQVSPDGESVYYAKGRGLPGIWRIPSEGGEEVLVLPEYRPASVSAWVPVPDGIYFADWEGYELRDCCHVRGPSEGWIKFLHFDTGQVTEVTPVGAPWPSSPLTISPDRQWFLYSQRDVYARDLVLVENFQ